MKMNAQRMFQELVSYIDFPTIVYINETGRIIARNYNANMIIGESCKNVNELIDNHLKVRFHRVILEQVRQFFNNVVIHTGSVDVEIDLELNVIRYGNQHVMFCFLERSYKRMYEKYLSLLVPRMFYKDTDLKFVYGSQYFLLDTKVDLSLNVTNKDFMEDEVSRYITGLESEIIRSKQSEFHSIHTIKSRSGKDYFARMYRMPVLDRNGDAIGLIGVYSIILDRNEFKGLFDATLRENQILNHIVSQQGNYVVSWKMSEGWPIEYISPNFSKFGYVLLDIYSGSISWRTIVHSGDYERIKRELELVIKTRVQTLPVLRYRIRKANGKYVWVEDTSYSLVSDGKTYLREGVFHVLPEDCYKKLEEEYERGVNNEDNKEAIW